MNIDISKITANLKDAAKSGLKTLQENPAEGSIFDAAKKLGINNKDDLKAGIELFKEDPSGAAKTAFSELAEKGFFGDETKDKVKEFSVNNIGKNVGKAQATDTKQITTQNTVAKEATTEEVAEEKTEQTSGEDTGLSSIVKTVIKKVKENPTGGLESVVKSLGLSGETAQKVSSIVSKFIKT